MFSIATLLFRKYKDGSKGTKAAAEVVKAFVDKFHPQLSNGRFKRS